MLREKNGFYNSNKASSSDFKQLFLASPCMQQMLKLELFQNMLTIELEIHGMQKCIYLFRCHLIY